MLVVPGGSKGLWLKNKWFDNTQQTCKVCQRPTLCIGCVVLFPKCCVFLLFILMTSPHQSNNCHGSIAFSGHAFSHTWAADCSVACAQVRLPPKINNGTQSSDSKAKHCSFLCGCCSTDADPLDPKRPCIRWAYDPLIGPPNGNGANCWICERLWAQESTLQNVADRGAFQIDIGKDVDRMQDWRQKRTGFIAKQKLRLTNLKSKRRAGLKAVPHTSVHCLLYWTSCRGCFG